MTFCAIVPMKGFDAAKTRLAGSYSPAFRSDLARAMFEDVLRALARVSRVSRVVVVTPDTEVAHMAGVYGARATDAGADAGQTAAVNAAIRDLEPDQYSGILTVPGDIPWITENAVSRLLAAHRPAPAFTIVPAHDRRGSNAIVISPHDFVKLAFGDDSFRPHLEIARRSGIEPTVVTIPELALDIDTPADLARFIRVPSITRTWGCLAEHGMVRHLRSSTIDSEEWTS
jgi:2-phospho-L-lactate guanylyltransferase